VAAPSISDRLKAGAKKKPEFRDVDVVLDEHVRTQVEALDDQISVIETQVAGLEEEKKRLHPQLPTRPVREKEIDEEIVAQQEKITPLEEQRDALRHETLVTLRFDKLPGERWAEITAHHPARVDVALDRMSGYNYHAASRAAAPLSGVALEPLAEGQKDDDPDRARITLSPEDWDLLFEQISGREMQNLAESLWELNDWSARRRIDAARKG
jgi:preprotein translocase subunit SecD